MDCVVLAGNRESYKSVAAQNKAYLLVDDRPVLHHMLLELGSVPLIDRIWVVGEVDRLEEMVAPLRERIETPIETVPQRRDLISNVRAAIEAAALGPDQSVLILPSDIPLLIAEEVVQFIERCPMEAADYVVGMVPEMAMAPFYPEEEKSGIKMAYFHLSEGRFRISNLHMARPAAIERFELLRKTYSLRYQKKLANIFRMFWALVGVIARSPWAALFYLGMQTAGMFTRLKMRRAARFVQRRLQIPFAERGISKILGTRFRVAITDFGGAALDIDNEHDYGVMQERFPDWLSFQKSLVSKMGETIRQSEEKGLM